MALTGATGLVALLADPVAHVKAPAFMNPLFESLGADLFLAPMHVRPEDLATVVMALRRAPNYRGVVLTIPHKVVAVRETELMRGAAGRGCRVMGGRPMAEARVGAFVRFFTEAHGDT